jgi:hypothetical protein
MYGSENIDSTESQEYANKPRFKERRSQESRGGRKSSKAGMAFNCME